MGLCRDCRRIHLNTLHYCIIIPGLVCTKLLSFIITMHNFAAFKNKSCIVGHTQISYHLLSLKRTLSSMSYTPHDILSAVCCCYQIMEFFVKTEIKLGCPVVLSQIHCQLFLSVFIFFSKPSKTTKTSPPPQKPLTLAYDGDMDM